MNFTNKYIIFISIIININKLLFSLLLLFILLIFVFKNIVSNYTKIDLLIEYLVKFSFFIFNNLLKIIVIFDLSFAIIFFS